MKARLGVVALVALVVGGLLWWPKRPPDATAPVVVAPPVVAPPPAPSRFTEDLSAEHLVGYGTAASDPQRDLEMVKDAVDAFVRSIKIPGALPTGGNRELVSALAGENAHRIRFIDPASPFINADGELLDRWQVPLFFHFVEANDVGVRSAGPDRLLWTADDVMMGEHAESE
jgi:hypothetical protein